MADSSSKPSSKKSSPTEDPILTFMKQAMTIPEYRQMMDYLAQRKASPKVVARNLGEGVLGSFEPAAKGRGEISIRPDSDRGTLVHEITHAVDHQMVQQYMENLSPQFKDSFEKLKFDPSTPAPKSAFRSDEVIDKQAPEYRAKAGNYRTDPGEAMAFAIQKHLSPGSRAQSNAPSHVDATLATEFLILLDQAQRANSQAASTQSKK